VFLHRFEHRRLGFRCGAVDFVGQDDLSEDGAGLELKLAFAGRGVFHDDIGADDIGGHQVRRELNPPELERENVTQRADQQCLAQPRHALQKDVSATKQTDQHVLDNRLVADDDLADLATQRLEHPAKFATLRFDLFFTFWHLYDLPSVY